MSRCFFIFDCETTGVLNKNLPPGHEGQARIVQLAGELHDGRRVLACMNLIVDPLVEIPEKVAEIHGITTGIARKYGVPTIVAMAVFNNLAKLADTLVAHNAPFDVGILNSEYARLDREPGAFKKPVVCTMLKSLNVLKLPPTEKMKRAGFGPYKSPNLQEAYRGLVDPGGFEGAHDAMADVTACRKVLFSLIEKGLIDGPGL